MELLIIVAAIIVSTSAAALAFTFPGFGVMQAMWISKALCLVLPGASGIVIPLTYAISSSFQSIKESFRPEESGNETVIAVSASAEPNKLLRSIATAKAIGWTVGMGLGMALAGFASSLPLTFVVLIFIVLKLATTQRTDWGKLLAYIVGTQLAFAICNLFGIANAIYAIGSVVFLLPACFGLFKENEEQDVEEVEVSRGLTLPNPISAAVGGAIAFLVPGINANAITMSFNNFNNEVSLVTSIATQTAIEAAGLWMLNSGVISGKSILAMELGNTIDFPRYILLLCTGAFFIAPLLFPILFKLLNHAAIPKAYTKKVQLVGALCIFIASVNMNLIAAAILLPLGLLIAKIGSSLKSTERSLLFIGGVL